VLHPTIRSFMWRCLHIPKFIWPSFHRLSCYSEGLTEVSWSVCDWESFMWFSLSYEDACTSPNSFDRVFIECRAIRRAWLRFHGVSCDSVFHVKMLAHTQICLTEFSLSVTRFGGSDQGFMECHAIRGLMRRGLHNPKFVWLRLSSVAICDWRSCDSVFDVNMVHEILLL